MHVVFVSSLVPAGRPESGYEIANHAIIEGLRRIGVRVSVIGFKMPGTELSDPDNTVLLGETDVRTDNASAGRKLGWLAAAVRGNTTFSSAKLRIVTADDVRAALKRLEPYDGLVLNGVPLAGAFERIFTAEPYLFVAHNVEHVSARQNAAEATGLVERLMFRREARYLKALERRLCDRASFVLTLADEDREPLGVPDDAHSRTLPLVTPAAEAAAPDRVPAFDVGLIGTWTWAPNRIGLEWFLQNVVPKLHPDVTVAVAGSTPRGFPNRDKRVLMLGRVDDAKEFQRQCRVIALASRAGTGVQLKTIETFELGLPAVATPLSLRGIAELPGNVVKADGADAFAEALHRQIVGQRTGSVKDLDGDAFRASQLLKMDEILNAAVNQLRRNTAL